MNHVNFQVCKPPGKSTQAVVYVLFFLIQKEAPQDGPKNPVISVNFPGCMIFVGSLMIRDLITGILPLNSMQLRHLLELRGRENCAEIQATKKKTGLSIIQPKICIICW